MGFFSAFKRNTNQSSVTEGAYNRSLSLFPQKPDHSQDGEEFPAPASAALSAKSFSYASVVKVCTVYAVPKCLREGRLPCRQHRSGEAVGSTRTLVVLRKIPTNGP